MVVFVSSIRILKTYQPDLVTCGISPISMRSSQFPVTADSLAERNASSSVGKDDCLNAAIFLVAVE